MSAEDSGFFYWKFLKTPLGVTKILQSLCGLFLSICILDTLEEYQSSSPHILLMFNGATFLMGIFSIHAGVIQKWDFNKILGVELVNFFALTSLVISWYFEAFEDHKLLMFDIEPEDEEEWKRRVSLLFLHKYKVLVIPSMVIYLWQLAFVIISLFVIDPAIGVGSPGSDSDDSDSTREGSKTPEQDPDPETASGRSS